MVKAAISELKASLSEYLDRVRAGEEVYVTDRGLPVAKLVPLSVAADGGAALEGLARAGLVTLPVSQLPPDFLDKPLAAQDPQGTVLKMLLEERESGR